MVKFIAAALSFAMFSQVTEAQKCHVLALSAGEMTSAYQAGAFKGLVDNMAASDVAYDVVTGVQGGAVNAALIGAYAQGDESLAATRMKTFWDNAVNTELYKDWRGGITQGFLVEGGLYNSKPLEQFLETELSDITKMNRNVNVGITNELTAKYDSLTQDNILFKDNLVDSLYASMSVAGFFAPVDAFGSDYYNGSAIWNLDIFSGVNKCLEKHSESDVVIDVILTSTSHLKEVDPSKFTSLHVGARFLMVNGYYSSMNAYLRAQSAYPNATFRYLVSPQTHFPFIQKPLNMSQDDLDSIYSMGESDAKSIVKNGNDIEAISEYFKLKTKGNRKVQGVSLDEFLAVKDDVESLELLLQ